MSTATKPSRRWLARALAALGVLLVGALVWWLASSLSKPDTGKKKRVIQEISLIKPPPPPPPKVEPPKVEPPKQVVQERIDVPKPDQQPDKAADAPPPGPDLGLDAKGTAGGDSFGLMAKKGGTDLIGSVPGGTGGLGNRFAWYGALVKERIQEVLSRDEKLRGADYRVSVNVWINGSGAVTRAELLGSTGNVGQDEALRLALRTLPPLREGAPGDMPQPVKLRITAR